jgi:predicted CoA-substrate-specific enzyme activase
MKSSVFAVGCDMGSLTVKLALIFNDTILDYAIAKSGVQPVQTAEALLDQLLIQNHKTIKDIDICISTGYGRHNVSFADDNRSEISCHAAGAFFLQPNVRTVIDIGGQDCKVISLNDKGQMNNFVMNDRCSAGTGHCMEHLANILGISVEKMGQMRPILPFIPKISNKCSIFMELEVLQLLVNKHSIRKISAGIADAVARRIATLAGGISMQKAICLTGGVSNNIMVIKYLQKYLKTSFVSLPHDPQIIGAIGAAVMGIQL